MAERTTSAWRSKVRHFRAPRQNRVSPEVARALSLGRHEPPRTGALDVPIRTLAERIAGGMQPLGDTPFRRTPALMRQSEPTPLRRAL